jgi:hypothetical protein
MARQMAETSATTGLGLQRETLVRGGLVGLLLVLAVGGIAWLGADPAPPSPLEGYRRMGPAAGGAALQRDLLREFPPGTPPAPLVRRLEGMGFACLSGEEGWRCTHAAPGEDRRVWRAELVLGLEDGALARLAARLTEGAP